MPEYPDLGKIQAYFQNKLETYGATPKGVDYNSVESQEIRYQQLIKLFKAGERYTLLDFGSGFGALYDYLTRLGHDLHYYGYDISLPMVAKGQELHPGNPNCQFATQIDEIPIVDYAIACGTFNLKLDLESATWTGVVLEALGEMNAQARQGLAFNLLTKYSDPEKMRPDLYYGDPLFFFDYCKRNFSRNVALLHDYNLYDFTILVRKG
jgi:SAM-dependent methyltransferase